MLDFDIYLMRYGEGMILDMVEGAERHRGLPSVVGLPLEERWDIVMNDAHTLSCFRSIAA